MEFCSRLKALRLRKEMTQKELGALLGVSVTTIGNWECGVKSPSMSAIIALSQLFQVQTDELLGVRQFRTEDGPPLSRGELRLLSNYRALDSHGKTMVDTVCKLERDRVERAAERSVSCARIGTPGKSPNRYIPKYYTPSAAGYSVPLDGTDFEMILADEHVPASADFAVKIQGHSMEPYISDQEVVYVERTKELAVGEVGIFSVDGAMYCKQYYKDRDGNLTLVSANEAESKFNVYVPAECAGSTEVICFGRVILPERVPLPDYFLR